MERGEILFKGKRARRGWVLMVGLMALVAFLVTSATGGASGTALTVGPLGVTQGTTYAISKTPSSGLAKTDPSLLGRTDSTPVHVMVKYNFAATASYGGGISGLPATSPRVTHKKLKQNASAVS